MSDKQSGFTLIELVMVIVILGVLGSTVLPKLTNLSGSAQYSKLSAALGSMKTAGSIIHSKAIASDVENGTLTLGGVTITVANGYPTADTILAASGVEVTDFSRSLLLLSDRILILWQNNCVIAYLDARWTSNTPQYFGVISSVNNTCP